MGDCCSTESRKGAENGYTAAAKTVEPITDQSYSGTPAKPSKFSLAQFESIRDEVTLPTTTNRAALLDDSFDCENLKREFSQLMNSRALDEQSHSDSGFLDES